MPITIALRRFNNAEQGAVTPKPLTRRPNTYLAILRRPDGSVIIYDNLGRRGKPNHLRLQPPYPNFTGNNVRRV